MGITATTNRIAVAEIALAHAEERYAGSPTSANGFEVEAAAITLHLALITPVTAN